MRINKARAGRQEGRRDRRVVTQGGGAIIIAFEVQLQKSLALSANELFAARLRAWFPHHIEMVDILGDWVGKETSLFWLCIRAEEIIK